MTEPERIKLRARIDRVKRQRLEAAKSEAQRAKQAALKRAEYLGRETKHGISRYQKGCRCDSCKAARSAIGRRHYAKRAATA